MLSIKNIAIAFVFLAFLSISAQPKIDVVGGQNCDWGKISPKDNPLKKDVVIRNSGNQKLIVKNVKPTCGCTTAPLEKSELEPGESTKLKVTLNIGGTSGPITKYINIESNDPSTPLFVLNLKANVVRALEVTPTTFLTFTDLQVGLESKATLKIKNTTSKPITITDAEIAPALMTINIKKGKVIKPGETFELVAKIRPNQKGALNLRVKLTTNDPDLPDLTINGYGNVKESPFFNSN